LNGTLRNPRDRGFHTCSFEPCAEGSEKENDSSTVAADRGECGQRQAPIEVAPSKKQERYRGAGGRPASGAGPFGFFGLGIGMDFIGMGRNGF